MLSCYRRFDHKHGLQTAKKSPPDDVSRQRPPVLEDQQEPCSALVTFDPPPPSLCRQCSSLDLPALFKKKLLTRSTAGDVILKLGKSAPKLRSSTCPLCRLFGTVSPINDPKHHRMHELRVIPADLLFTRLKLGKIFDTNVLSVQCSLFEWPRYHSLGLVDTREPTQALGSNFGVRLLDLANFDVAITSHWIDFCRLNHSGDCVPTALIGISSFRVINCTTQSVINAPQNCQFVALSYVWGRSDLSNQDRKSGAPSLHAAPKVIADSIEVTRLLGFQYLWVDRYCINQSDTYEKHDQICRMDAIYASAQLTIIAAGDDPDMGLPGVNGTLRNPQPIYQVRDYTLVSSLTAASASLHQTAWASRGWTYQEGLLSKRRLLFLSDQVYFECNGMHCTEVIHLPLEAILDKETGKTKTEVSSGGAFAEKTVGDCPWWVMRYVSRFTRRKLSYQSDVLNAFQGIFRVFEKSRYPLYQLMGVPIMLPYATAGLSPLVLTMISRSPEDGFMIGLLWRRHEFRLEDNFRRTGLPSWTWAGWNGRIAESLEFSHSSKSCDFGVQILVEMADRSLLPFPHEYSSLPQFLSQANDVNYIHITAKVSACEILYQKELIGWAKRNHRSPYVALIGGRTRSLCLYFEPDDSINGRLNGYSNSNKPLHGTKFTAIILATEYEHIDWQVSVLVVEERGDYAEWVGICLTSVRPDVRSVRTRGRLIANFPFATISRRKGSWLSRSG